MNAKLIQDVENKIVDTYLLAQKIYRRNFELPKISFDLNSTRTAGLANYGHNQIKINPAFLELHTETVINRTVPHEVAHLLTHNIYPHALQHHGPEWKSIARALGISDERCHTMVLPGTRPNIYKCHCKQWFVSNLVHSRILKGVRLPFCGKCKSNLQYVNSFE